MISVIINTKDRPEQLQVCVRSLRAQTVPVRELIIVDAGLSPDSLMSGISELLRGSGIALKYFHTVAGNSYQRNVGIEALDRRAEYVCFFDDDVELFPDTIARYIAKFRQYPEVGAVQAVESNRTPQHWLGRSVRRMFSISYESDAWRMLASGENVNIVAPAQDQYVGSFMVGLTCVRRMALQGTRFDEWFRGYAFLEDYDFSYRMAQRYPLLISPGIPILHHRRRGRRLSARQMTEMLLINKTYFFKKHVGPDPVRLAAYLWSLVGYVVLHTGKALYTRDIGYVSGTLRAFLKLATRKAGV